MKRRLCEGLIAAALCASNVRAMPQTWMEPHSTFVGSSAGSRFGSEVACTSYGSAEGLSSIVALAAPQADSGRGRVYLYRGVEALGEPQVLTPPTELSVARFGSTIQFIDDINGDGRDDLLIGAPGTLGGATGRVFAFISGTGEGGRLYSSCGQLAGTSDFGVKVQALRVAGAAGRARFVAAAPEEARVNGYSVEIDAEGSCSFNPDSSLSATGDPGGGFGSSLAQIQDSSGSGGSGVVLAMAASMSGVGGVVTTLQVTPLSVENSFGEVSTQRAPTSVRGSVVSGSYASPIFLVGEPDSQSGRGTVSVYSSTDAQGSAPICVKSKSWSESSAMFGRSVAHIGSSFEELVGSDTATLASFRSEDETGGSLALFGVNEGTCSEIFQINNCEQDPQQEQASAIAGGGDCHAEIHGQVRHFIVVGSPGWDDDKGRVDIYVEGAELISVRSCMTASLNLSAEDSALPMIPVGGETPSVLSSPSATATMAADTHTSTEIPTTIPSVETGISRVPASVTSTATAIVVPPAARAQTRSIQDSPTSQAAQTADPVGTPEETAAQTPTPTSTIAADDSSPTDLQVSPTASYPSLPDDYELTPAVGPTAHSFAPLLPVAVPDSGTDAETPVAVSPGSIGLPAPKIEQQEGRIEVVMPKVQPVLSDADRGKAIRRLMKTGRMTRARAEKLVSDPANLIVTYIVEYSEVKVKRGFSLIASAHADAGDRGGRSAAIKRVRSRLNRVTLSRLQPGLPYQASYRVEISIAKPRMVIGVTRVSSKTQFTLSQNASRG